MSVVDLHPEDLLDRHANGTLTTAERARLDAHAAICPVCCFELQARADFASLSSRPLAVPRAPGETNAGAPRRDVAPLPDVETGGLDRRRPRRRALVLGLAAALVGGMSFAALSSGLFVPRRDAPTVGPRAAELHPSPSAVAAATSAVRLPVDESPPAAGRGSGSPSEARGEERASESLHARPTASTAEPPRARPTSAADLFHAANAARRQNDTERAVALYRELESQYPRSQEARVSYATLATLLLDRGDPQAALDGFDQYLSRGDSALGEEALVGRALAFQKLRSRDSEIAAWQEILRRFPDSVHARVARARLLALGPR